jgi:hypothetical protein
MATSCKHSDKHLGFMKSEDLKTNLAVISFSQRNQLHAVSSLKFLHKHSVVSLCEVICQQREYLHFLILHIFI